MKEHFSELLENLRRNLILMGGEVDAFVNRDAALAKQVIRKDDILDARFRRRRRPARDRARVR